jgi:cysteinyl-tRNA synthetase
MLAAGGALLLHASIDPVEERDAAHVPAVRSEVLAEIRIWAVEPGAFHVADTVAAPHDLLVIDEAMPGVWPSRRMPVLEALKRKADGGRRLVLASLSIGAAESHRDYWQQSWLTAVPATEARQTDVMSLGTAPAAAPPRTPAAGAPGWLGPEHPGRRGTFAVRFWQDGWQALLFGSEAAAIDRLVEAGFDGVYLDGGDAFAAWTGEVADARQRMIDLIVRLSAYAKRQNRDFMVALHNADDLLSSRGLREALDIVVRDGLLFGPDARPRPGEAAAAGISALTRAQREGLAVLVAETLPPGANADAARRILESHGFIPSFVSPMRH